MSEKELRRAIRLAKKRNRLGIEAKCEVCGLKDVWALRQVGKRVLCAACHLREQGKSSFEFHHVAGEANDDFKIRIPANDHAGLSGDQYDWPIPILRNENADPLLKISAMMRGKHIVDLRVNSQLPEWAPDLERLSAYLVDRIGENWASDYQKWKDHNDAEEL